MPMRENLYVQYGCGFCAPKNWRNFDVSPTLRFEKLPIIGKFYTKNAIRFPRNVEYGDIVRGLPLQPASCRGIYASHTLEHLSLEDFRIALKNTSFLLVPGGIFRFVVPDLEILAKNYINSNEPAAEQFMRATSLGTVSRQKKILAFLKAWIGNSAHLWMWDFKSLYHELTKAGFTDIRRAQFGDSIDPMFKEVEDAGRFVNALGIECRKPFLRTDDNSIND
jgi:hypothetical protein